MTLLLGWIFVNELFFFLKNGLQKSRFPLDGVQNSKKMKNGGPFSLKNM